MAATASICASASEAALLVASFMPFSLDLDLEDPGLDLGTSHRRPRRLDGSIDALLGTPHDEYSLVESPLGEYRQCQTRTAMRRHFGSRAAGLCASDGILTAIVWRAGQRSCCSPIGRRIQRSEFRKARGESWPASTTAIPPRQANAPAKSSAKIVTPIFLR
jgi:hypothetical protein